MGSSLFLVHGFFFYSTGKPPCLNNSSARPPRLPIGCARVRETHRTCVLAAKLIRYAYGVHVAWRNEPVCTKDKKGVLYSSRRGSSGATSVQIVGLDGDQNPPLSGFLVVTAIKKKKRKEKKRKIPCPRGYSDTHALVCRLLERFRWIGSLFGICDYSFVCSSRWADTFLSLRRFVGYYLRFWRIDAIGWDLFSLIGTALGVSLLFFFFLSFGRILLSFTWIEFGWFYGDFSHSLGIWDIFF